MPITPGTPDVLEALRPLFYRQRIPSNPEQENIVRAWDAIELVHSDGFESLLEQDRSLRMYASSLAAVGLAAATPILEKVRALIPLDDDEDEFWAAVRANFEGLKVLAEEFWACADYDEVLREFVERHPVAFADYTSSTTTGA